MRPVILYGVVRVALFAAALTVFLVVGYPPYLAAVLAVVVAFCIAYIAFAPLRRASAEALAERRRRDGEGDHVSSAHGDDEDVEDSAVEGTAAASADGTSAADTPASADRGEQR